MRGRQVDRLRTMAHSENAEEELLTETSVLRHPHLLLEPAAGLHLPIHVNPRRRRFMWGIKGEASPVRVCSRRLQ